MKGLIALVLVVVGAAVSVGAFVMLGRLDTSCGAASSSCTSVLFVGNSYTSTNDLPGTFARLSRAAGRNVTVAMVAPGGQTLAGHAADDGTRTAISSGRWTYVVLQEQSEVPAASKAARKAMADAAKTLATLAANAKAKPILFETWAHRDGWPEQGLDGSQMQDAIDAAYGSLASALRVPVAPVGAAWQEARTQRPDIALWQPDGSHPTAAGTYLAAAVLYVTIFGRQPVVVRDTSGLDGDTAIFLRSVAGAVAGR
jgi:lysophospholipase L1-like esterase